MYIMTKEHIMNEILTETLAAVVGALLHNSPYLVLGVAIAAVIKVHTSPERLKELLLSRKTISIPAAVAFGALTPFCACGSMAIVISLLTTALPWGPIMAFLTSSPLMSPDGFVMIAGIVSTEFAVALTIASLVIGLGSGYLTHAVEKSTRFLEGQARFSGAMNSFREASPPIPSCLETIPAYRETGAVPAAAVCCCAGNGETADRTMSIQTATSCGCTGSDSVLKAGIEARGIPNFAERLKLRELGQAVIEIGLKQVLPYFALFTGIGHLINRFVPASIIMKIFGADNPLSVPLLAITGLPLYVSGASTLPVINALLAGGASSGSLLAFLITGPGTSAGVIAGLAMIMKRKAIMLYAGFLLAFAIVLGHLYDLIRALVL